MDIWLILYALTFLFAIPRTKWHRKRESRFWIQIGDKKFRLKPLSDPVETRYFRSDTHLINGLTAYQLKTSQTTTSLYFEALSPINGAYTVYYYFQILKRDVNGNETLIVDWTLHSSRSASGSGLVSANWACPATSLSGTDAIRVNLRVKVSTNQTDRSFITEQLGASSLDSATWTIWLYTYCVRGSTAGKTIGRIYHGDSTYDSRILNFTYTLIPSAPTNCSVSILSETSLRVSWTDASTDEDDFHVERKDGGVGWTEVQIVTSTTKTTTGTVYTWDNSGLLIYTTYYYRVRAHRHSDNIYSNYSNEAYATTPFYAPTNLVAISLNIDAILVQWNDNSQVESDYHLERKTSLEPTWAERTILPANSVQFTDPGLDPAIIYTYRVRAHNHAQGIYTTYSNEASEAPKLLAQIPFNPFTPLLGYY